MTRRLWLLGVAAVSAGAVAAALYAQHRLGMQPCPWCILQRVILCAVAVLAAIGAGLPAWGQRLAAWACAAMATCGGAAALYQNLVAAKSPSCDLTIADRIISGLGLDAWQPDVFEVRASCAEAAVSVLGVPFELWSLLLFVSIAGVGAWLGRRR